MRAILFPCLLLIQDGIELNQAPCYCCNCAMGRICGHLLQSRLSHQGSTSQGFTKHLLVFVCNELCLILHNLCSGGHVTEGDTEGEWGMNTELKERERLFVHPPSRPPSLFPQPVQFPSEYFGNNLNPVLDYKLLKSCWSCRKSLYSSLQEHEAQLSPTIIQCSSLFMFCVLRCSVASGQSSDVMLLTPQGVNS